MTNVHVAYAQVQQQLVSHMRRLGLPLTSCNGDMEVLRKAIVQVGGQHCEARQAVMRV